MDFNSLLERERDPTAEYCEEWKKSQVPFSHKYFRSSWTVFHRDPRTQPSTSMTQSLPACLGIERNHTKTRAALFKHDSRLDKQQPLMTSLILLVIHMSYDPASPISRNNNLLLGWFFFRITSVTRGRFLTAPCTKASAQLCALCQHCRNASWCNSCARVKSHGLN